MAKEVYEADLVAMANEAEPTEEKAIGWRRRRHSLGWRRQTSKGGRPSVWSVPSQMRVYYCGDNITFFN
uniref:Uncharacterized protein n=1 Tax=Kalanchoe fedtschenkoi TaxID=63787 RepID=A0A7N0TR01_KALFE